MSAIVADKPKGKRGLKALQAELVSAKARWGGSCKAVVAKGEGAPWPVALQRTVPQPEKSAWDVYDLTVKLVIERKPTPEDVVEGGRLPLKVNLGATKLPKPLRRAIAAKVESHWRSELARLGPPKGWLLEKMLMWVELRFETLIKLCPPLIEF